MLTCYSIRLIKNDNLVFLCGVSLDMAWRLYSDRGRLLCVVETIYRLIVRRQLGYSIIQYHSLHRRYDIKFKLLSGTTPSKYKSSKLESNNRHTTSIKKFRF